MQINMDEEILNIHLIHLKIDIDRRAGQKNNERMLAGIK